MHSSLVPNSQQDTVILLRTHVFGDRERRLVITLERETGLLVVIVADETRKVLNVGEHPKVSVTRAACTKLGLFCPDDFTWRTGDYGLYLARHAFPHIRQFWMIEPDVEHSFASYSVFLSRFDTVPHVDLLSSYLRQADPSWYWKQTMRGPNENIYRCFFALIRISSRALDACLAERVRRKMSLRDRLHWPNDEVFVATTVIESGLVAEDFNNVGKPIYSDGNFGYDPRNGDDSLLVREKDQLFHPVLYGSAYAARLKRHHENRETRLTRARRRLQRIL